ncbi:MAG: hypothetical protein RL477_2185 [Pseudomonadota bacterium]|jgi:uncharacterized protein GlcG (DUF336 family)
MAQLTLDAATKIVAATIAAGRDKKLKLLAVAVLDERGALKAFGAEDGTSLKRGEVAIGKAMAALDFGIGTRSIDKMAKERPYFISSVAATIGGPFVPVPGGVLVKDKAGAVIGAVGVSGDVSNNDEMAAVAGIRATGLEADPGSD